MGLTKIKTNPNASYILDTENAFKRGITLQREMFKNAKLDNDYDQMCDSLENIKAEIKHKAALKNEMDAVLKIEKILDWYRTIETRFIKNTPDGKVINYPPNIHYVINKRLTYCYEEVIRLLGVLDLL